MLCHFSPDAHLFDSQTRLGSSTLERVIFITDLGVISASKLSFTNHIDVTISKGLAMLGFIKRLSSEFREPNTLKFQYLSLVRSKLFEPINAALHNFNEIADLDDFYMLQSLKV
jgi:hypothetical protein